MNFKAIGTVLGILFVLSALWLIFVPMHQVSENMTTTFINPATSNTTALMTSEGLMPTYNSFQGMLGGAIFWIIVIGIIVAGGILIMNSLKGSE